MRGQYLCIGVILAIVAFLFHPVTGVVTSIDLGHEFAKVCASTWQTKVLFSPFLPYRSFAKSCCNLHSLFCTLCWFYFSSFGTRHSISNSVRHQNNSAISLRSHPLTWAGPSIISLPPFFELFYALCLHRHAFFPLLFLCTRNSEREQSYISYLYLP